MSTPVPVKEKLKESFAVVVAAWVPLLAPVTDP